ncbi:hypothetical protein [Microbacterium sp. gxy059]|uniref:hypothetical protein n=1 Tax=Microbacterium sp. gxy059 TaxID=2957199 RepID=UPI003D9536E2
MLAQHPDRFVYVGGGARALAAPIAALVGVVLVFAGGSRLRGDDAIVVDAWGIGLVILGFVCVLPRSGG